MTASNRKIDLNRAHVVVVELHRPLSLQQCKRTRVRRVVTQIAILRAAECREWVLVFLPSGLELEAVASDLYLRLFGGEEICVKTRRGDALSPIPIVPHVHIEKGQRHVREAH